MNVKVVAISGNHDSPERIGFGAEIMSTSGVYMSHPFNGNVEKVTLEDECGPINIYMLPFIKPAVVRPFFQEDDVSSYDRAMEELSDLREQLQALKESDSSVSED